MSGSSLSLMERIVLTVVVVVIVVVILVVYIVFLLLSMWPYASKRK